ncbi:MAG: RhuM family protein [Candidatus Moranbacteria bacterium]|nr:RhuM family protein [Candidatus Moranbacteria bacterium]
MENKGEVKIFKPTGGEVELQVRFEGETVWLRQSQIAELFGTKRPAITKHLNNIFKAGELDRNSVCSVLEHTAEDGKKYKTQFYNLDAIISVGYRVNSKRATQFRIWATSVLKKYLLQGYAINEQRLAETKKNFHRLQETINFLQKNSKKEQLQGKESDILDLLADYSKTLSLLENYDKEQIGKVRGSKSCFILNYEDCRRIVASIKTDLLSKQQAGEFFGKESGKKLEAVIKGIYQTFSKKELYPSIEKKASHLLYLIIKDHPFIDGNKRIASFLFVYFLDKNNYLYRGNGEKKINDNALTAIALLTAESKPTEKDNLIALIEQLLV